MLRCVVGRRYACYRIDVLWPNQSTLRNYNSSHSPGGSTMLQRLAHWLRESSWKHRSHCRSR